MSFLPNFAPKHFTEFTKVAIVPPKLCDQNCHESIDVGFFRIWHFVFAFQMSPEHILTKVFRTYFTFDR
jgi:hypothetical protein